MLIIVLALAVWAIVQSAVTVAEVLRTVPRSNDDCVWY